jgi:hypothetical protein
MTMVSPDVFSRNNNHVWHDGVWNSIGKVDLKLEKDQEVYNEMKKQIEEKLNEQTIMLQGIIMDLQRKTGKEENFERNLYESINRVSNNINELQKSLTELNERFEYAKEILDGLKVAHELAEGYSEYKDKQNSTSVYGSLIGSGTVKAAVLHHTTPSVTLTSSSLSDSNLCNEIYVNVDTTVAYDNKESKVKQVVKNTFDKITRKEDKK